LLSGGFAHPPCRFWLCHNTHVRRIDLEDPRLRHDDVHQQCIMVYRQTSLTVRSEDPFHEQPEHRPRGQFDLGFYFLSATCPPCTPTTTVRMTQAINPDTAHHDGPPDGYQQAVYQLALARLMGLRSTYGPDGFDSTVRSEDVDIGIFAPTPANPNKI